MPADGTFSPPHRRRWLPWAVTASLITLLVVAALVAVAWLSGDTTITVINESGAVLEDVSFTVDDKLDARLHHDHHFDRIENGASVTNHVAVSSAGSLGVGYHVHPGVTGLIFDIRRGDHFTFVFTAANIETRYRAWYGLMTSHEVRPQRWP